MINVQRTTINVQRVCSLSVVASTTPNMPLPPLRKLGGFFILLIIAVSITIAITIPVSIPVSIPAPRLHPIKHQRRVVDSAFLVQLFQPAQEHFFRLSLPHDEQCTVGQRRQQQGIADETQRRGVYDQVVEMGSQVFKQPGQTFALDQFGGIGGNGAAGNVPEGGVYTGFLHDFGFGSFADEVLADAFVYHTFAA